MTGYAGLVDRKQVHRKAHRCRSGSTGAAVMGLRPACSRIIYDYTPDRMKYSQVSNPRPNMCG